MMDCADGIVGAEGLIQKTAERRSKSSFGDGRPGVGNLIPTTHRRFAFSEPRDLPGETDSGTEIISIPRDHGLARIRRVGSNVLDVCEKVRIAIGDRKSGLLYTRHTFQETCPSRGQPACIVAIAGQIQTTRRQPVVEQRSTGASGCPKQTKALIDCGRRQAGRNVGRRVVLVAQPQVQGQRAAQFKVIFREEGVIRIHHLSKPVVLGCGVLPSRKTFRHVSVILRPVWHRNTADRVGHHVCQISRDVPRVLREQVRQFRRVCRSWSSGRAQGRAAGDGCEGTLCRQSPKVSVSHSRVGLRVNPSERGKRRSAPNLNACLPRVQLSVSAKL